MVLLLVVVLAGAAHFGAHSQDWCIAGRTSLAPECSLRSRAPVLRGADVTRYAPRFGYDFSQLRTLPQEYEQ